MKFTVAIAFAALVAVAAAAPRSDVEIVRQDSDVQPEGYKFAFATSDGTSHDSEGQLKDAGTDHEAIVVHGSYSYVGEDGVTYSVNYVADENGFQPQGAHIPQP